LATVGSKFLKNFSILLIDLNQEVKDSLGGAVTGTSSAPVLLSAAGQITPSSKYRETLYVRGNGAAITLGSTPIAAGTVDGQEITLVGTSDTNTVTVLASGTGVFQNGDQVLRNRSARSYLWDATGTVWIMTGGNFV
jgi:hypothetical protein